MGQLAEERAAAPCDRALVLFALAGQRYALPLAQVQRTLSAVALTALPQAPDIVMGIVDVRGVVMPVINLRRRFHHPERSLELTDHLIIARAGGRTVALCVDEALGVLQDSPETLAPASEMLPGLEFVAGALKLADGLVLIHDLERLLSLEEGAAVDRALATQATAGSPAP